MDYQIIAIWKPYWAPTVAPYARLPTPIQSSSREYEIAVENVYLTTNIINTPEDNWIIIRVEGEDDEYAYLPPDKYVSVPKLAAALRIAIENAGVPGDRLTVVKEREKERLRWRIGEGISVLPSLGMAKLMGYPPNTEMTGPTSYVGVVPTFLRNYRLLFLKTDLISPNTLLGNSYQPILDTCPIYHEAQMSFHPFDKPKYQKIRSNWIEKIEIKLCDENGRDLRMNDGVAYVMLHIKEAVSK